jgi:hypothetical protein
MSYLPIPARAWSRVQNQCSLSTDSSFLVFDPLNNTYLTQEQFNKQKQIQIKGNILQYKNNSSNITKKQKYSLIAKGNWINRTKVWATQSTTYSNPNIKSFLRVNTSTLAETSNTPFVTNIYNIPPNPFNCPTNTYEGEYVGANIIDGGNLVGNTVVNPCNGQVIKVTKSTNCNLSSDCDVPGPQIVLCWNPKLPAYYPRQNLINNNSTDKWPINYKGLKSALKPYSPILTLTKINNNTIYLFWNHINKSCVPTTSFNLFQGTITDGNNNDASLINTFSFSLNSTQITNLQTNITYYFYIIALSNDVESEKSNQVSIKM